LAEGDRGGAADAEARASDDDNFSFKCSFCHSGVDFKEWVKAIACRTLKAAWFPLP
jgi:hypothetical protein